LGKFLGKAPRQPGPHDRLVHNRRCSGGRGRPVVGCVASRRHRAVWPRRPPHERAPVARAPRKRAIVSAWAQGGLASARLGPGTPQPFLQVKAVRCSATTEPVIAEGLSRHGRFPEQVTGSRPQRLPWLRKLAPIASGSLRGGRTPAGSSDSTVARGSQASLARRGSRVPARQGAPRWRAALADVGSVIAPRGASWRRQNLQGSGAGAAPAPWPGDRHLHKGRPLRAHRDSPSAPGPRLRA